MCRSAELAAHIGPWPQFLRQLVVRFWDQTPSFNILGVKSDRGRDWQYLAQITLMIYFARSSTYVPTTSRINDFLRSTAGEHPDDSLKVEVTETLSTLLAIAADKRYNAPLLPEKRPGMMDRALSPIEFIFVGFLTWCHPELSKVSCHFFSHHPDPLSLTAPSFQIALSGPTLESDPNVESGYSLST